MTAMALARPRPPYLLKSCVGTRAKLRHILRALAYGRRQKTLLLEARASEDGARNMVADLETHLSWKLNMVTFSHDF